MSTPNEQCAFMQSQAEILKHKEARISSLSGEYKNKKLLLSSQGISTSIISGRVSISGASGSSRRIRPRTRDTASSGSSAQ